MAAPGNRLETASASSPPAVGLAVCLLSMAMMTAELVLTRIFSVIIWYHFAFFAISVALFGASAAAIVVHLFQRALVSERTPSILAWGAAAESLAIVLTDVALVNLPPEWFGGASAGVFSALSGKLVLVFLLAALPFVVGGFTICLAMARHGADVHRLYSWDLLGAGAACLLVVPLLSVMSAPSALVVAAALAGAAVVPFRSSPGVPFAAASCAVLMGAVLGGSGHLEFGSAKGVDLRTTPPEYQRWNAFSLVTVLPSGGFRGWGISPAYTGPAPVQKLIIIDLNAATVLTRLDGSPEASRYSLFDLSALVYRLKDRPSNVCVIGAGGGKDVLAALAAGARHVTGAEINPMIVNDVVRGKFADYAGHLYSRPDVEVHVEDGRSFVRRTDQRFDVLLLSMVDTSAATAAGAYALTENSLYTSDAFADFLSRLAPGGVLSVSTVSLEGLAVGARLVATARAAVERQGGDPSRSVAVAQTPWLGTSATLYDVLVKPSGFSDDEIARLGRSIDELQFRPAYLPGRAAPALDSLENGWIRTILGERDPRVVAASLAALPIDVSAVGDDRPFFFYQNRVGDFARALVTKDAPHLFGNGLVVLAKVLVVSVFMVLVLLLLPLVAGARRNGAERPSLDADVAYVACLGLGFMFVEMAVVQRFSLYLGQPTQTLAVVLFVLLVGGGIGSRAFAGIRGADPLRRLRSVLVVLLAYIALLALVNRSLLGAAIAFGPSARSLLAAVLLAPLGVLLGVPYPTGLAAVSARAPSKIAWLWAINGGTSVLGSVLATLVSLHVGIDATLWVGGGMYGIALVVGKRVVSARGEQSIG